MVIATFLTVVWFLFRKRRKLFAAVCLLLILLTCSVFVPSEYWSRMKTTTDVEEPAIEGRLNAWKIGGLMILDHPFIGVGLGKFKSVYMDYAPATAGIRVKQELDAHSTYIRIAAQMGVPALVFFCLLILWTFKDLRSAKSLFEEKGDVLLANLSRSLAIALVAYLITGTFGSQEYLTILWIIIPLCAVLKRVSLEEPMRF